MSNDAEDIRLLTIEIARQGQILDAIARQLGIGQGALLAATNGPPADVVDALHAGNKILAIKLWREHTNSSLAEAKNAVEELERGLR